MQSRRRSSSFPAPLRRAAGEPQRARGPRAVPLVPTIVSPRCAIPVCCAQTSKMFLLVLWVASPIRTPPLASEIRPARSAFSTTSTTTRTARMAANPTTAWRPRPMIGKMPTRRCSRWVAWPSTPLWETSPSCSSALSARPSSSSAMCPARSSRAVSSFLTSRRCPRCPTLPTCPTLHAATRRPTSATRATTATRRTTRWKCA